MLVEDEKDEEDKEGEEIALGVVESDSDESETDQSTPSESSSDDEIPPQKRTSSHALWKNCQKSRTDFRLFLLLMKLLNLKTLRAYNVFLKMPFHAISCFIHYYYIYRGLRRVIIIKNNNYNTTSFPNDEDRNAFMI